MRPATWLAVLALLFVPSEPTSASDARIARPIVVVSANQSFNWAGYVQGRLAKGTTFHSVSAEWIVPKVRQRNRGVAEHSSSWIGIGGGCLNSDCTLTDSTLIQAGIEHDVDVDGNAHYYAWWETIPAPLIRTELPVGEGDRVRVQIAEDPVTPQIWTIAILNLTTGGSFTLTLPYTSTYGTVEWVIETPIVISDDGGITVGPMPQLGIVRFDNATANGVPAGLIAAEQMQLVDFDLSLIAAPSLPDLDGDGFNDCTYRRNCQTPHKELP
ncbi:MAG TPA: G1 family glutamic endopeptidase [Candidatus Limnocylindria bacterium]|nr:G1 family glutamic endopeptidase [Candidatus Limnocylindria bacterium]